MDKVAEIRAEKTASYQGLRELFGGLGEADWSLPAQGHAGGWTVVEPASVIVPDVPLLQPASASSASTRSSAGSKNHTLLSFIFFVPP